MAPHLGVDVKADQEPDDAHQDHDTKTLRTRSAMVRPAITADGAIGSERNRSMMPLWRSSASPMAVLTAPNATVEHEDAGHQEVDVVAARHCRWRRRRRSGTSTRR